MAPELIDVSALGSVLPSWTLDENSLVRTDVARSFAEAIAWVVAVSDVAESVNHHPDIDIRFCRVTWRLTTFSAGGLTQRDVELAHAIDAIVNP